MTMERGNGASAFSPDGKTILDSTARMWEASNGRPIGTPITHPSGISAAVYSPDGKTVLTAW